MDVRTPLQPAVVTPKQALSIKPFGLDMNVLLTTEACLPKIPSAGFARRGRIP
jgi:hypothetical protein